MIRLFSLVALLVPFTSLTAGQVSFDNRGDDIIVSIDGKEFSRYHTSTEWKKPYFHPVLIDGTDITRPIDPNQKEHPHHKGIWVSVDEVNEIDYWGEKGDIVNKSVKTKTHDDGSGTLLVVNHWVDAAGKPVVIESTEIHIAPNRLLTYDISFNTPGQDVEFLDTKEGLLGFRMAESMKEEAGGKVLSAEGVEGARPNWGKHHKWIDYYGEVEGKTFGVTLMDHPKNPYPSRYHVRWYGLFSISPFGEKAYTNGKEDAKPLHLKAGETFKIRYGIYFHTGDTNQGEVAQAYRQFLSRE